MSNRIIDVNINRISEALRVLEDISRFYLEEKKSTLQLKQFRQKIRSSQRDQVLLMARDIQSDKTKFANPASEFIRIKLTDIISANSKRIQEASRVLEELYKISDKKRSLFYKQLRFFTYDLEKKFVLKISPPLNFSRCLFINISSSSLKEILQILNRVRTRKPDALILRTEDQNTGDMLPLLKIIKNKFTGSLIIQDRPDLAVLMDADGILFSSLAAPVDQIKNKFNFFKPFGLMIPDISHLKKARSCSPDYILVKTYTDKILKQISNSKEQDIMIMLTDNKTEYIQFCRKNRIPYALDIHQS